MSGQIIQQGAAEAFLQENGYLKIIFDPAGQQLISEIRSSLVARLNSQWHLGITTLEQYHIGVVEDNRHTEIQNDLSKWLHESSLVVQLVATQLNFLRSVVALDLHIQKYPYLRIARPGNQQDNIGIHRDTHYGSSPYELSIHIPFTDHGVAGSLGYIPGSHTLSDRELPYTQANSSDVEKGSVKHKLGFLYAPKPMDENVKRQVAPIHTKVGEALMFCLGLVHGQEVNRSDVTRFSTDIRVVNSLAPIQWGRNVHGDYYMPLTTSAVTAQAQEFLRNNSPAEAQ